MRTVVGSAQNAVSCDVAFSAKSCICAHGHGGAWLAFKGRVHTRTENKHEQETRTSNRPKSRTKIEQASSRALQLFGDTRV